MTQLCETNINLRYNAAKSGQVVPVSRTIASKVTGLARIYAQFYAKTSTEQTGWDDSVINSFLQTSVFERFEQCLLVGKQKG